MRDMQLAVLGLLAAEVVREDQPCHNRRNNDGRFCRQRLGHGKWLVGRLPEFGRKAAGHREDSPRSEIASDLGDHPRPSVL